MYGQVPGSSLGYVSEWTVISYINKQLLSLSLCIYIVLSIFSMESFGLMHGIENRSLSPSFSPLSLCISFSFYLLFNVELVWWMVLRIDRDVRLTTLQIRAPNSVVDPEQNSQFRIWILIFKLRSKHGDVKKNQWITKFFRCSKILWDPTNY